MSIRVKPPCGSIALMLLAILVSQQAHVHAKSTLNIDGIYGSVTQAQNCLSLTWNAAVRLLRGPAGPNCLRMAFHDAGTYSTASNDGGANGSVMLELSLPQHAGLTLCPDVITGVVQQVHNTGCPQLTVADAIQVAGAAAVNLLGGPACNMLMGRPDKGSPDITNALPDTCDNAVDAVTRFTNMGFKDPVKAVVVLSGAHNVGNSRATPRGPCSKGLGPLTDSPASFDGHYYTEVVTGSGRGAWFSSDRHLNDQGAATAPLMKTYSDDHQAFLGDWCGMYQEMSLLGVDIGARSVTDGWAATITPTPTPGPAPVPKPGPAPVPKPGPAPVPKPGPGPAPGPKPGPKPGPGGH